MEVFTVDEFQERFDELIGRVESGEYILTKFYEQSAE
jgi:hypothetical protein